MVESNIMADLADILSVSSQYFPPVCISRPHFEALNPNQNLILRFWRQTAIFKSSFWGLDTEIKATKCRFDAVILPSGQNVHPEMKPQILRFSRQRKRLTRDFAFPPLSEICKGNLQRSKLDRWFLRPKFTKSSLKKVAKYGKIKASQKKEVL